MTLLYWIYLELIEKISLIRVFRYISIRALIAFFLSYLIILIAGKPFINYLRNKKIGDDIREWGPKTHYSKKGTPTMGGVLIIISVLVTNLIAGNLFNRFVIMVLLALILLGAIGFVDDFKKFTVNKKGLSGRKKIKGQLAVSVIIWSFIVKYPLIDNKINLSIVNPLLKDSYIYIGAILMLLFVSFIIIGSSNAVNITDGLDGLVIVPVMIVSLVMGIVAYFTGNIFWSEYLNLYYIDGVGELTVFMASILGSGLGFLWYNFYPAQIFMGDTGSLALGGILAVVAIFLKQEILLGVVGIVFVVEALSVIIQVFSYKKFGKRVFKMAPIHHHFELEGLPETKVTARFWIISILFGILGLLILKLR